MWLCAVRRREDGSDEDAFPWFAELHAGKHLLPTEDDLVRDQAEVVTRLQRKMRAELLRLVNDACGQPGREFSANLAGWIFGRVLVIDTTGMRVIWCALSSQGADGRFVPEAWRELLFAALADHLSAFEFEVRSDWPSGPLLWCEVVQFGLREQ